ncbi:hypothetical protein DPEC_G00197130 [Dallia pectoralis]|uniref:Uncharacterized protein n=1 Tax=Dallia pectoralis TaxID=75939 RepID=A0ACC2G838_DALPE|nr:hypothetical protein DPEC_G00197130 [Dallia pectoralis]
MPHKKRTHSHQKKPQGQTAASGEQPADGLTTQAAVGSKAQSQPRQYSPTSVAQVAVNPTQFESASVATTMATKPGTTSVTMTGATGSGVKARGSAAPTGTTQPGTVKGAENPRVAASTKAPGATIVEMPTPGTKGGSKDGTKGVPITPGKANVAKQDPAKVAKTVPAPVAPAGVASPKGKETKVQVEVAPPAVKAKQEVGDPFNALADYLPSSAPLNPNAPEYTGPVVSEHVITSSTAVICGGKGVPLPPGYRYENTAPVADVKPKEVPKPLSTDEALDSLSFGFTSSDPAPQKQETKVVHSAQASVTKSAASPADKTAKVDKKAEHSAQAPATKSAAPPADKPAKMEKKAEQFASAPMTKSAAPPADKKAKVEKAVDFTDFSLMSGLESPQSTKPKTDESGSMSLDALDALGDTLGAPEPVPESPKIRPEDIVKEKSLTADKGVFVGEREDTLPPEYRFTGEKHKDLPLPKPEPSMDSGEALDILSGDFMSPSVAHGVHAPIICPPAHTPQVFACRHEVTKKMAPAPVPISIADQDLSLDALDALGDTLGAPEPVPESPKINPADIVMEDQLSKTKGVFVGERDDTLPPGYRFNEDKVTNLPPPKPEPSMDSGEALDILSGDFMSPSVAHGVQAPIICPPGPPPQAKGKDCSPVSGGIVTCTKASSVQAPMAPPPHKPPQSSDDFALDALAGDFTAPSVAPTVKSAAVRQMSTGTADALDVLSNTLIDSTPVPEPAAPAAKDIVKEKKVTEEKVVKMGERDDSLPPEYRPTKEDQKAAADAKACVNVRPKQPSMDDSTALDLLSGDFTTPSAAAPVTKTTEKKPQSQVPMTGPVLDKLSDTLLPESIRTKDDKPKSKSKSKSKSKKHREEDPAAKGHQPGHPSSDVVQASTTKGGKS